MTRRAGGRLAAAMLPQRLTAMLGSTIATMIALRTAKHERRPEICMLLNRRRRELLGCRRADACRLFHPTFVEFNQVEVGPDVLPAFATGFFEGV